MSVHSAVLAGRRAAVRTMLDTCLVRTVADITTDDDGVSTVTYSPDLYNGPCRVQSSEGQALNPEVAGATITVQRYRVDVPVGAFRPEIGQVVTIVRAALDPNLAGRSYRVAALQHKTAAMAYQLGVEEVA